MTISVEKLDAWQQQNMNYSVTSFGDVEEDVQQHISKINKVVRSRHNLKESVS